MSHTYAVLEVSASAYAEIRALLEKAEYQHTFHTNKEHGEVIDMHGIALADTGTGTAAPVGVTKEQIVAAWSAWKHYDLNEPDSGFMHSEGLAFLKRLDLLFEAKS